KYAANAVNRFIELVKILSDEKNPYARSPDEKESCEKILAGSMYYKAESYTQLSQPADKVPAYRQTAIKGFEELVQKFPKSDYSPAALSQVGTLWT
ncbi:hypothetical protein P7A58_15470, partial [Clostridium perfringens]|nr:hypothetical protein [Clostridium perfringens]